MSENDVTAAAAAAAAACCGDGNGQDDALNFLETSCLPVSE